MTRQKEYRRTKTKSKISKIAIDRGRCAGIAACLAVSAGTFKLDEKYKAVVIEANTASDHELLAAAKSCPLEAILLFDKNQKRIFPK